MEGYCREGQDCIRFVAPQKEEEKEKEEKEEEEEEKKQEEKKEEEEVVRSVTDKTSYQRVLRI